MADFEIITTPVGLHDGNLIRYERRQGELTAVISAWNATQLTLVFHGVWLVKEFDALGRPEEIEGDLNDLRECIGAELIAEAKQRMKALHCSPSEISRVKHYQLCDNSAAAVLEVIAEGLKMHHEANDA